MSDKIKRLAKNITELLANTETPQETYYSLLKVLKKQKDYFQHMSPDNVIKLLFYCYSYGQTKSFEQADKMLNNIGFAVLFNNSGDYHREECDNCSGGGEVDCQNCDGTQNVECDECSGTGEVVCDYCEGEGTDIDENGETVTCPECDGKEEITCPECHGHGEVSCDSCTSGKETCEYCDGNGEVETKDYEYERYFIVTWDKYLRERCEYTEGDTDISFSEYDFDRLRDKYIKLKIEDKWVKFDNWVNVNEIYCSYYDDNPKMYLTNDMELDTSLNDIMTPYTKK
jgi:RecJ-like exonuclease